MIKGGASKKEADVIFSLIPIGFLVLQSGFDWHIVCAFSQIKCYMKHDDDDGF